MGRLACAAMLATGCADESQEPGQAASGAGGSGVSSGGATGGAGVGGAGAGPMTCAPNTGPPQSLAPGLDGMDVLVAGTADLAPNIAAVAPEGCTEGLLAALLVAPDDTKVLLRAGADPIFCGCPEAEHALCGALAEGQAIWVTGALTYDDNGLCNQTPCYEIDVDAVCAPVR